MKKVLFLGVLCFGMISCNEILEELEGVQAEREQIDDCEKAKIKAFTKAKKGVVEYVIFGDTLLKNWQKEFYFRRYLKFNHGIEVLYASCNISKEVECYTKVMDSIIENKYGRNFIKTARRNARRAFNKGLLIPLESGMQSTSNDGGGAGVGERDVEVDLDEEGGFMGGEKALHEFVIEEFKMPKKAQEMHISGLIMVQFVIEKSGYVSNVKSLMPVERQLGYGLEQECMRVLKSTNKMWVPAQKKGKPVRSYFRFPFEVDNSLEEEF